MSWTDRDPASLSLAEINEILTREFCGLPAPPDGAPAVEFRKWIVAGFFLNFCEEAKDASAGKMQATNFLLQQWGDPLSDILPHIESALGRKLTDQELAQGHIASV